MPAYRIGSPLDVRGRARAVRFDGPGARWIALACLALAASWLYSCSEDSTTCPVCPAKPGKAFLGTWVIFESWMNGNHAPIFLDTELEFRNDDTVMVRVSSQSDSLLYTWMANDSVVVMESTAAYEEILVFSYEFEADTLNMEDKLDGVDVYWRLLKK